MRQNEELKHNPMEEKQNIHIAIPIIMLVLIIGLLFLVRGIHEYVLVSLENGVMVAIWWGLMSSILTVRCMLGK